MVCGPCHCARRYLKLLNTSDLRRRKPLVMAALPVGAFDLNVGAFDLNVHTFISRCRRECEVYDEADGLKLFGWTRDVIAT